jgi:hypothetical protein
MTQTTAVVSLLRSRGDKGLTPLEALEIVGSLRLAARIADARDPSSGLLGDDEEIVTESVTRDGKTYARYVLRRRATPGIVQTTLEW